MNGSDGGLDNNDNIAFIALHAAHDPKADVGITGGLYGHDGVWDNNDFVSFIDLFFAGCETVKRTCDPGFVGELPPEEMLASQPASLSEAERQQQLDALLTVYNATGDSQVLERINALAGSGQ